MGDLDPERTTISEANKKKILELEEERKIEGQVQEYKGSCKFWFWLL